MTERDLIEQREQIQEDILSILDCVTISDGERHSKKFTQSVLNDICQVIVDRFKILLDKFGGDKISSELPVRLDSCHECGYKSVDGGCVFCNSLL